MCQRTIKSLLLSSVPQLGSSVHDECVLGRAAIQQRTNISYREDYTYRDVCVCVWVCV